MKKKDVVYVIERFFGIAAKDGILLGEKIMELEVRIKKLEDLKSYKEYKGGAK